ncbi:hypothetical protein DL96DRAFT_1812659 [Flagelloscypha sp. PMI_526]|nr:hypothetical protein DL96DRAFT_1812659 [Flagelloscypha sp. PMI_526]
MSGPPLAERTDIHKSCKALETLLNLLNDYCEAASAIVALQKKLAKSLRDTASLKTNTDIAANALSATATIFDALADIDSKYAKLADKEYDAISTEVKKWFKKLAKEEKAHDERMTVANNKLKQAGQAYEKRSKKSKDAGDEHARYINLINTLGPEVSQEKYNHALAVTQKHTVTTYSVAACVTRLADAEWVKSCEAVRRFSPTVGQLGECRALCEGGWTGQVPYALPDIEEEDTYAGGAGRILEDPQPEPAQPVPPAPAPSQPGTISARNLPKPPPLQTVPSTLPPPSEPDESKSTAGTINRPPASPAASSRELDPSPATTPNIAPQVPAGLATPNHTPAQAAWQSRRSQGGSAAPPSSYSSSNDRMGVDADTTGSVRSLSAFPAPPTHYPMPPLRQSSQSSLPTSDANFPRARLSESPLPQEDDDELLPNQPGPSSPPSMPVPTNGHHDSAPSFPRSPMDLASREEVSMRPEGDYFESELGYRTPSKPNSPSSGSGSIVAAMRNRYSSGPDNASPPPVKTSANVRLPTSVSEMANRYQPESPSSPSTRYRNISPPSATSSEQTPRASFSNNAPSPPATNSILNQKEEQLRQREREIEMRARALELERSELEMARRNGAGAGDGRDAGLLASPTRSNLNLRPRERHTSLQSSFSQQPRTRSQIDLSATTNQTPSRPSSQYGYYSTSTTNLVATSSEDSETGDHAPSCGCDRCSASKYQENNQGSATAYDLRPPAKPITLRTEKPKGWMRRLSMPVVAQFSSNGDSGSKKGISSSSPHGRTTGGMMSLDGRKSNLSGGALGLRTQLGGVLEDGRYPSPSSPGSMGGRRSYESGNRSSTNLAGVGVGGGRRV